MKLVYKNENQEESYTLNKEGTTIGRAENNTIHLQDNSCSRNHCVIEYRDKQYHITDLRSYNGIKVNGQKVPSHTLENGDVITLGKTVIKVIDIYMFTNDCSVTATHLRKKEQETFFTELSKWKDVSYAKPFVYGLVGLFVLALILRFQDNYSYYQTNVKKYHEILKNNDIDTATAISQLKEMEQIFPQTSLSKSISESIERLEQKRTYYGNAKDIFSKARGKYENQSYLPKEYIQVVEDLLKLYPEIEIQKKLTGELIRAKEDYQIQITKVFESVQKIAQQKMSEGKFGIALNFYRNFAKDYPYKGWRRRVDFHITKLYVEQSEDWANFTRKIDFLESKNRFIEMRMLTLTKYEDYLNTPLVSDVQKLLDSFEETKETQIVAIKKKEKSKKTKISSFLTQYSIQKLIKKDKWHDVIAKLKQFYKQTKNKKTQKIILGYMRDFENLSELQKEFLGTWQDMKDLYVPIANREAVIRNIEDNNLILGLRGESGSIHFKWHNLPPKVKLSMLKKVPFDEKFGFGLASLCMVSSLENEVHEILIAILQTFPKSKGRINSFFSRWTGVPIPKPDGFIVFRDLLIHPKEKVLVEYRENIRKFCQRQIAVPDASFSEKLNKIYSDVNGISDIEIRDTLLIELGERLFLMRKKLMQNVQNSFDFAAVKYLEQLKTELNKRRKHALELIFDEKTYPADETKGAAAQPDVDKRVAAVREIWETPAKGIEKLSPKILKSKKVIFAADAFLKKQYTDVFSIPKEERLNSLNSFINGRLDIKNYAASPQEYQKIELSKRIMIENDNASEASTTEKRQVTITNAYRHMMGRTAVRLNSSLTVAARKHSGHLRANNIFAHVVPGEPEGATPMQRARTAGYGGSGVGENIYMGRTSPQEAHNGWVHSAGHHRNILRPSWKSMGAGQSSNYWTQKFGNQ